MISLGFREARSYNPPPLWEGGRNCCRFSPVRERGNKTSDAINYSLLNSSPLLFQDAITRPSKSTNPCRISPLAETQESTDRWIQVSPPASARFIHRRFRLLGGKSGVRNRWRSACGFETRSPTRCVVEVGRVSCAATMEFRSAAGDRRNRRNNPCSFVGMLFPITFPSVFPLFIFERTPSFTPPPLRGEGWEGGACGNRISSRRHFTPTPTLPPQGGGRNATGFLLTAKKGRGDVHV